MKKVSITSRNITKRESVKINNVTSVFVSNLSPVATTFIFNGVTRNLGAFDAENSVPFAPFLISDNGNFFDVELNFNKQNYDVILDYTELIPDTNETNNC